MRVRKLLRHVDSSVDRVEITCNGSTLVSGDILEVFRSYYADGKVNLFCAYTDDDGGNVLLIDVKGE